MTTNQLPFKAQCAYTPRVSLVDYNAYDLTCPSVTPTIGCFSRNGSSQYGFKSFALECISESEDLYGPRLVQFCDGPEVEGVAQGDRFYTRWAVWMSSGGMRYGIYDDSYESTLLTSAGNTMGSSVGMFNSNVFGEVSMAFDVDSNPMFCAEYPSETIILKRRVGVNIFTYTWSGCSPILFYDGIFLSDRNVVDVVCVYIKKSSLFNRVFARFQRDSFAIEYVINDDFSCNPDRIINQETDNDESLYYLNTWKNGSIMQYTSLLYPSYQRELYDYGVCSIETPSGNNQLVVVDAGSIYDASSSIITSPDGSHDYIPVDGGPFSISITFGPQGSPPTETNHASANISLAWNYSTEQWDYAYSITNYTIDYPNNYYPVVAICMGDSHVLPTNETEYVAGGWTPILVWVINPASGSGSFANTTGKHYILMAYIYKATTQYSLTFDGIGHVYS